MATSWTRRVSKDQRTQHLRETLGATQSPGPPGPVPRPGQATSVLRRKEIKTSQNCVCVRVRPRPSLTSPCSLSISILRHKPAVTPALLSPAPGPAPSQAPSPPVSLSSSLVTRIIALSPLMGRNRLVSGLVCAPRVLWLNYPLRPPGELHPHCGYCQRSAPPTPAKRPELPGPSPRTDSPAPAQPGSASAPAPGHVPLSPHGDGAAARLPAGGL